MMNGMEIKGRRIFLYKGQCDMRRSFDRLARMVQEDLETNPLNGDVYVFLNRDHKKIKCMYWEDGGYVIWYKRLEFGKFVRPLMEGQELDQMSWMCLLEGIKIKKREPRYKIP